MPDLKEEYLAILLEKQEVTSQIAQGGALILEGGIDGIKEIAETHPEILLAAIQGLVLVIESSWKEHLALVESYFELTDRIDALS